MDIHYIGTPLRIYSNNSNMPRLSSTAATGPDVGRRRTFGRGWKFCLYMANTQQMYMHYIGTPLQIYSNNSNMPGLSYTATTGPHIGSDVGRWRTFGRDWTFS